MRHGRKINHLSRTSTHRKAMLSNMASSLIIHKKIKTTVAKAKALRTYVEPILTKAKVDSTHTRRMVFSYLHNKESVKELFREVASKIASRQGGYTRILKLGNRLGDNAEMCYIELVDYNVSITSTEAPAQSKTRRKRRTKSTETKVEKGSKKTAAITKEEKLSIAQESQINKDETIDTNKSEKKI